MLGEKGEKYHGTSWHYMNERLDDGPIIATEKYPIEPSDTTEDLFHRSNKLA